MKLTADYKWRRLRRWVNERYASESKVKWNRAASYEAHVRAQVFHAVLLVMDAENRRAAAKPRRRTERSA